MTAEHDDYDRPEIAPDGTVRVRAFDLPLSAALSAAGKALLSRALSLQAGGKAIPDPNDFETEAQFSAAVDAFRMNLDEGMIKPAAPAMLERYPVTVEPDRIGGVPVETFTPLAGLDGERTWPWRKSPAAASATSRRRASTIRW